MEKGFFISEDRYDRMVQSYDEAIEKIEELKAELDAARAGTESTGDRNEEVLRPSDRAKLVEVHMDLAKIKSFAETIAMMLRLDTGSEVNQDKEEECAQQYLMYKENASYLIEDIMKYAAAAEKKVEQGLHLYDLDL